MPEITEEIIEINATAPATIRMILMSGGTDSKSPILIKAPVSSFYNQSHIYINVSFNLKIKLNIYKKEASNNINKKRRK